MNIEIQKVKSQLKSLIEQGYLAEAKEVLPDLQTLIPNDPDIYAMNAILAYFENNIEQAVQIAMQGLLLAPDHGDLLYNVGHFLHLSGRLTEAKHYFSLAFDRTTDPAQRDEIMQTLGELEHSIQMGPAFAEKNETFVGALLQELHRHLNNDHKFNLDIESLQHIGNPVRNFMLVDTMKERSDILRHVEGLADLYDLLADDASKKLLLQVLAFRMLGNYKVKLPLNTPSYWAGRRNIRSWATGAEPIRSPFHNWEMHLYDLAPAGHEIRLYYVPMGISATYFVRQYEYDHAEQPVKARPGDVVIDCGGCWGDTALYFADLTGPNGSVYSMEFIPSNLEILRRNVALNPEHQARITVVEHPVWSESGQGIYYTDQGPASMVTNERMPNTTGETTTLCIDDLTARYELDKVDFIKMDIEGAEMAALRGATATIVKHRPTVAVAVYHQISDFYEVVRFFEALPVDYDFYLDHATIYAQETVLFAVPRGK